MKLSLTRQASRELESLDAKQSRQVTLKVIGLLKNPEPHDSSLLTGGANMASGASILASTEPSTQSMMTALKSSSLESETTMMLTTFGSGSNSKGRALSSKRPPYVWSQEAIWEKPR
jgi:hypothetical protein